MLAPSGSTSPQRVTMARLGWVALGGALAAYGAACSYPDFQFTTSGSGSGGMGGASSASSMSSTTGTMVSSGSDAPTSSSTSSGGVTPCKALHDTTDCQPGERCTVVDADQGTMGCIPLGPSPVSPGDACFDDTNCPAGTWCDGRTLVCSRFCNGASSCASKCVAAESLTAVGVPGVTVCTAHCDPVDAFSCGNDAACGYDSSAGDFDCFQSGGKLGGEACSAGADCAPTYVCAGSLCQTWCHPTEASSSDCFGGFCSSFSNLAPMYGGDTYGYCD